MSESLSFTSQTRQIVSWKSRTFTQVVAGLKRNENTGEGTTTTNYFRAGPIKLYRREVASVALGTTQRSAVRIDVLTAPNGFAVTQQVDASGTGVELTLDAKDARYVNDSTQHPGSCTWMDSSAACFTVATNALRRVRSGGMVQRKFDAGRNSDSVYHTDSKQYLVSRNKTFSQNQYNFVRVGDASAKPGSAFSLANIYAPNGVSHCRKFYVAADASFQYQWTSGGATSDTTLTTVDVPAGYYNVDELNQLLRNTMAQNAHYYLNLSTDSYVYLLNIGYNSDLNQVELQTYFSNQTIFPPSMYSPQGGLGDLISATTDGTYCPFFVIPSSMADVFGIPAGTYPATGGALDNTTSSTTVQTYNYAASGGETTALVTTSSYTPLVGASPYRKVYYKPSNHQFANQGAVTGSSYITRKIYNAVTSNTAAYLTAYGSSVANEMVYGINDSQRATLKSRMGVQTACVPVFAIGAGGEVAMSSSCRYRSRR